MTEKETRFDCFSLIFDIETDKIFLNKSLSLPISESYDLSKINDKLKQEYNIENNMLFNIDRQTSEDKSLMTLVNLSVCLNPLETKNGKWFNVDEITENRFLNLISEWKSKIHDKYNTHWFNYNWLNETKDKIRKDLPNLEITDIKQYYVSPISCILKLITPKDEYYLKRVLAPVFKTETLITSKLAELFPEYLPNIVYVDDKAGLILTEDFGENILSESKNIIEWENTLKDYARLQIKASKYKDELLKSGLFDRTLENMPEKIENILNSSDLIFLDQENTLTTNEKNEILSYKDKITDLSKKLAEYNIPETIEHGDLHAGNIALNENRNIFYDWSDCAISHPFISLRVFLWDFFDEKGNYRDSKHFSDYPDAYQRLTDAYLSEWKDYGTKEQLREAFDLATNISWLMFSLQYCLLVSSMEKHVQYVYKGHIARGFRIFLEKCLKT